MDVQCIFLSQASAARNSWSHHLVIFLCLIRPLRDAASTHDICRKIKVQRNPV